MALFTSRDQFAAAIAGPMAARCIRPHSTNEEIALIAEAVWKLADAMVAKQGAPTRVCPCGHGGKNG